MDMQVVLRKQLCFLRVKLLYKRHGDRRRLLHHIAELTGDRQLAISLCKYCLDKENLASGLCPCKPRYDTRLRMLQNPVVLQHAASQKLRYPLCTDGNALFLTLHKLHRRIPAKCIQLLLQSAHTGLCRIF